jgi:uncharacterized protein (UPF0332 family)
MRLVKEAAWENMFNQVFELWITPEVKRRQAAGLIARPYALSAAQVIFHADGRPFEIRLNEQVRAMGKVKLKTGVNKNEGDAIYADEVESFESVRLADDEDPNCGHITLRRLGDKWTIWFDLIYNKGRAKEHLAAAREFLAAASTALANNNLRAFVDTCFSAAELAAKALLMTTPSSGERTIKKHGSVHSRYNAHSKLGNVKAEHRTVFNRLAALRTPARYLGGPFALGVGEAQQLLRSVEEAVIFAEQRVNQS